MFATEKLARWAGAFEQQDLSDDVVRHAQRALIDWYASLYPGLSTPAVATLLNVFAEDLDRGQARILTTDGERAATTRTAALIHGTAAHAAELDDSFKEAMYHPGAATIAAALAVAQERRVDGLKLLRAVVLGYELSTRIGVVMGRHHYKFWHNTGTIGTFGAAAASACLYQLDEKQFANAMALSATFTAGLQQAFRLDAMAKPLHAGRAAEAGILAARLAMEGMTSSLDVLDGENGFGTALGCSTDWSGLEQDFGQVFNICRLTFKNHVGVGHTFPAIDGALELQRLHAFNHADIAALHLGVYQPTIDIAGHMDPKSPEDARFSLPYMVATALVHGSVRLTAFSPERVFDPATRALMARITSEVDAEVDAGFPQRRAAKVTVELRDGRRLSHLQTDRKGDPELPLSDGELVDKFLELVTPSIGDAAARTLLARIWSLPYSPTSL